MITGKDMCMSIVSHWMWERGTPLQPGVTMEMAAIQVWESDPRGELFQIFSWYKDIMKFDKCEMFERYNGVGYDCN